jgi:selenocysteine lyase/cysteine desulfurase
MPDHDATWRLFREQMPIARQWAYFDNAAVAPLPAPAQAAVEKWAAEAATEGDDVWGDWVARAEKTRRVAAQMIGAALDEVAFVANTTTGIGLIAEGYPWRAGDNVVIPANEFPTNAYPWLNLASRGVEVRRVPNDGARLDLDRLLEACDARTRLISLSWIGYASGWRADPAEIVERAHRRQVAVMLDAIQGLGVFPLDVHALDIDFVAADGHKWLLGPEGAGLLYVRRDRLDELRPLGVGWNSVVHSHDYGHVELVLRPEAARYEGGSLNMVGVHGLGASLELLAGCGLSPSGTAIADRVIAITDFACERLRALGAEIVSSRLAEHRSGIVSFDLPGRDPARLRRACREAKVALSCREGHVRISPHAYATEDDVDRLIDALDR